MSGQRKDAGAARVRADDTAAGRSGPAARRADRGSGAAMAMFLLGVAVLAGAMGFALNRATASPPPASPGQAASAAPTAAPSTAAVTGSRLTGLTAEQVAIQLSGAGVPLHTTVVFNAANDPNKLLGTPNGYTSKIAFADARTGVSALGAAGGDPVDAGGSIEVFADQSIATARSADLRQTSAQSQLLREFTYQQSTVVLRVSRYLSDQQAQTYQSALARLGTSQG